MRSNMTGVGVYNSEYRNFNRGHGRGNNKSFQSSHRQPSPQPSRRGDLFMEAGRLAVDYLVAHGLLSSSVLPGKSQNGFVRSNSRDFKDKEFSNSPADGRPGATYQGASNPEGVSSSRKSPNDQDVSMARNSFRDRRRYGASRSYSSDWSRDNGREGSLSDKMTATRGTEDDNANFPKDTTRVADTDDHNSHPADSSSNDNRQKELHDEMEKFRPDIDTDPKMTSTDQDKDDQKAPSDGVNTGCEETKDGTNTFDMEKETSRDEIEGSVQHSEGKNDTLTTDGMDLLTSNPSAKMPTEVHSSVISESPKSDPLLITEEKSRSDTGLDSLDSPKDDTMNGSSEIPSSTCAGTAVSENSFRDAGVGDPTYAVNQQKQVDSLCFTDRTFSYEQKPSGLPDLGICSFTAKDRGEKRAFEEEKTGEGSKKAKQWLSVAQSDEYSQLPEVTDKQSILPAKRAETVNHFNMCADQGNFSNDSLPLKGGVESAMQQGEEKQLFSSSFKICDLNLMSASDMHEHHDVPALLYPSISVPNKDASVDIDLSMNNNCSLNSGYNDGGSTRKDIEIIDLESVSLPEGKSMPTRNMETDITSMGNFPNNSQNANENPDGQDGYGFMISELLGNDVPNCPSVQPDMNSLQNDMGLHHGEGMFTEDDPIYMSLGEIPISLLRVWEQPTQERNPFEL